MDQEYSGIHHSTIKALSLWQPWATLLATGEKKIETRSWPWRGDLPTFIAIHAAKKWSYDLDRTAFDREPFASVLGGHDIRHKGNLPFGKIIAVVRLVECVNTAYCIGKLPTSLPEPLARKYLASFRNEKHFGDYSVGRYAWVFDRFLKLDQPIAEVGRQSLWDWMPTAEVVEWMHKADAMEVG